MKQCWNIVSVALMICVGFNQSLAGTIVGKVKAIGARNGADAVIYINAIPSKTFAAPKEHAKIDQMNMTFKPHVLPVLTGTTVDFMNNDDVLHNVFSPDACAEKFNLGTWPKGQMRSYTFKQPGCQAVILCNVHPEMEAFVVVVGTPYYAVSAKDGSFTIKDVPPGKYELKIWHEKLKGESVTVTVPEKGEVTADFTIKR